MAYTATRLTSNKVKLTFDVPAETLEAAIQSAYLKNRGRINVPGFRKGKAPRRLIENMYGAGIFFDDAFEAIFPDVYQEAVEAEGLEPVGRPEIDIEQMNAGENLKFSAEVFVRPEVTLGTYKGIKATKYRPPVSEEEIDRRIEQDVRRATIQQEVTDRPVQEGDTVDMDYLGSVDGVPFEGGQDEHASLKIGSNQFIPGFEEQMVGMNAGEEKDITVTFPEQYHAENLAGKEAVFHVKVHAIQQDLRPELDDEFAADVSEFTTFAEYREAIVKELDERRDKEADSRLEDNLIEQAVDAADMDIPDVMVDDEINRMLRSLQQRLAYSGMTLDDFINNSGMDVQQMVDMYRPGAQQNVKRALVLDAIRKAEDITATEEEVDQEIADYATSIGMDAESFAKSVTHEQWHMFEDQTIMRKVVNLIKDSAEVTLEEKEEPSLDVGNMMDSIEAAAEISDAQEEEQQEAPQEQPAPKKPAKPKATRKKKEPAEEAGK
ncbi:MAG TPA: trigger factor [Clostridiales bacterium]|nr:trigger factor [Clostridiales bacterium]